MMSNRKRIAVYTVAATAALSGGVGTLMAVLADGAGAQSTGTTAPAAAAAPDPAAGRGRPDDVGRVDVLAVAAQALGMDAASLRTELEGGKSMAAVAKDKGVDEQKVIDAIVAARTKAIDDAVTAGRLTADEAGKRKADLSARVKEEVERAGLSGPRGDHGPGGPGRDGIAHIDDPAIAATALGLDPAALKAELQAGKSIAQVAKEKNLDVQKAIDAIVAADTKAIDDAVTAGRLTADEAAKIKAGLPTHVKDEVERVGFGSPDGPDGPDGPGGDHHGGPGRGGPRPGASSTTGSTPSTTTTG